MNDSYGWYWATYASLKQHVMCQEIGHLFGLGHTSEDGSSQATCMDYSGFVGPVTLEEDYNNDPSLVDNPLSQSPNDHDYDTLVGIYEHLEGGDDGGGPGPKICRGPFCLNLGGPEIPPMGSLVHKGRSHEIWVARGPNDTLWVHHVTLVPEEYR